MVCVCVAPPPILYFPNHRTFNLARPLQPRSAHFWNLISNDIKVATEFWPSQQLNQNSQTDIRIIKRKFARTIDQKIGTTLMRIWSVAFQMLRGYLSTWNPHPQNKYNSNNKNKESQQQANKTQPSYQYAPWFN